MAINIIQTLFFVLFLITAIIGFFFRVMDFIVPQVMVLSSRYEKYTYFVTEHLCISRVEIPERWFKHFYKIPVLVSSIVFGLTIAKYFYQSELPEVIYWILDKLLGTDRKALVPPATTVLALLLLTVQCAQRFYEMHFVSTFSDKETRELCNYVFAYIHYGALIASLIGESQGFVRGSSGIIEWNQLTCLQGICAITFLVSSFEQLRTNIILANLIEKKRGNGKKCEEVEVLPRGGLFEYVSGAIEFTEAIMYLMLYFILRQSSTYHYVFFWNLANEATMATFSHSYYRRKYRAIFPNQRKAFIPFIY